METMNFTCGHCGNIMAVTVDLLGQQVRCPHCQQVVLAPAPPPPLSGPVEQPPPFSFSSPPREEDSIFSRTETPDELFGEPKPPALEIPAEPSGIQSVVADPPQPRSPSPAASAKTVPDFERSSPSSPVDPAPAFFSEPAPSNSDATVVLPPEPDWPPPPASESLASFESPAANEEPLPVHRSTEGKKNSGTVLIFLIPYALFMTFVAAYFYFQSRQAPPHPLEFLPDWPGDNPGTKRTGQAKTGSVIERVNPEETKIPQRLRVGLGHTIQIGSLAVTPLKVEKRNITFRYDPPNQRPETSPNEALVLTLRVKNVSADEQFYPTDLGFNPKWQPGKPKPYTFLEMGSKHFFGGPIEWKPRVQGDGKSKETREYIEGQENDREPLNPNEERVTLMSTNPDDASVLKALSSYRGPLVWRVQLRRGLVRYKDKEHSVSAVIGVEFLPHDIH